MLRGFATIMSLYVVFVIFLPVRLNGEAIYKAETLQFTYDEILTDATNDAALQLIKTVENDSIEKLSEGNKINYQTIELNLDQALDRFYKTLYLNLNIENDFAKQQAVKINIPIKIVAGYDGYYVDYWRMDGKSEKWSDKKLYSTIDNTHNIAIRFTLDDNVYIKDLSTGEEFQGKREDIKSKYPGSCLADEQTFNEVKGQVINQHIKQDLEFYTSEANVIAKRNGWNLRFNTPYWGNRSITEITFIAFMQGYEVQGTMKYNNFGYSSTKIVKNNDVYGYIVNGNKLYSYDKQGGSDPIYFQNEIEAAKNGYSPDLRKIK